MLDLNSSVKISSIDLCNKINEYRKIEGDRAELNHNDLMKSIRKEINNLKNIGIELDEGKISLISYKDSMNRNKPCYEFDRDFALQILNKESTFARYKTIEYINTLEEQISEMDKLILKSLNPNLIKEERIEIERRRAELSKKRDDKANWFDIFLSSEGTYNSTQVAKLFKISSARKLNQLLNENKIIYKQGKNWYIYSEVDKSWYKLIVGNSNEHSYSQLKFTPKGVYEISKLLGIDFTEEDLEQLA